MTFKESVKKMLSDGEFERIINYAKGKDKKEAIKIYDILNCLDVDGFSPIALLQQINSVSVLKDVICYMMRKDK